MRGPDYVYKKLRPREVTFLPPHQGAFPRGKGEEKMTRGPNQPRHKGLALGVLAAVLAAPRARSLRGRAARPARKTGGCRRLRLAHGGDASNLRDAALRGRAGSLLHRGANAFAALFRFSGKLLACPLKRHICVKTALFRFAASTRLGPLKRHFCVKTGLERRMRGPSGGGM